MIWHHVVNVKYTVNILSICVAFLENMNFNDVWQCLIIALICRYEKLLSVKADLDPFRYWASPDYSVKKEIQTLTDFGIARYWLQS